MEPRPNGSAGPPAEAGDALELLSFYRGDKPHMKIVPASRWRDWMNATPGRYANRCLPLLMANQAGWVLLNPAPFTVSWEGGHAKASLTVRYDPGVPEEARIARSHFGSGILTFVFRDAFRTPPGYNLFVRGPTNSPKDGICALDGLVETDWSAAPFTMNWKLTRPGTVAFSQDEPFCHITPQRRGELERFQPVFRSVTSEPGLAKRIGAWSVDRTLVKLGKRSAHQRGHESWQRTWMKNYFKGEAPTGESSPEHQTNLRLEPFTDDSQA